MTGSSASAGQASTPAPSNQPRGALHLGNLMPERAPTRKELQSRSHPLKRMFRNKGGGLKKRYDTQKGYTKTDEQLFCKPEDVAYGNLLQLLERYTIARIAEEVNSRRPTAKFDPVLLHGRFNQALKTIANEEKKSEGAVRDEISRKREANGLPAMEQSKRRPSHTYPDPNQTARSNKRRRTEEQPSPTAASGRKTPVSSNPPTAGRTVQSSQPRGSAPLTPAAFMGLENDGTAFRPSLPPQQTVIPSFSDMLEEFDKKNKPS